MAAAVLLATGLIDKNGTAQDSPAHNSYVGDAAGFFLLAELYALSTSQSTSFSEVDGFDSNSGWTVTVGDETFAWNVTTHAGHATRDGANLSFSSDELAAMRSVSDEDVWDSLKDISSPSGLTPWLKIAELIDTSGDSNHAAIGHNTVETAAEFVVLTTLLNLSGSSHNSFSTLAPVNADEGTIPYALQTTVEDEFVWNNSVHAGHTTRAGENLTVSESEVSEIRNLNFEAALLATGLVDKNGTAQDSPAHNSYVGDAAGFFLLAELYALSTSQSTSFSEVDGFDSNSGWTVTVGDETFAWNVTTHAGHATRDGANLSFSSDELAAMRSVSDEDVWDSLKDISSPSGLTPWLKIAELIDTSGDSNHAAIGHNTVETAAEFVVLTTLLNLSGSSHNSFSTLAPVNADEGTIPYALQTTVEDEFVWNNSVHAGHTTRAGENLTVSESEVSEIRNLNFEAALLATGLVDKNGTAQDSPAHNSYVGDAAGFFLLAELYALSTSQSTSFSEVDGFDSNSGWTVTVGDETFAWNVTTHAGHATRDGANLSFSSDELAAMRSVSDEDVWDSLKDISSPSGLTPWLKIAELIDTSGDSNHAAIGHNTVETAAEFVVLTTLLNLSGSSHNSFSTLAPVNADEGTIPYALQTTVEDEFVWNNSVHAGHTTRAGENLTVSESEVSEIRNLNFEAALLATGLVDKNGTAQDSPAHNSYVGDAAGFFLLAELYALSTSQSTSFSEVDGFDSNSGWTVTVGDETFAWNVTTHAGHATRDGANLSFSSDELAAMRSVSDEDVWDSLKDISSPSGLTPWLKIAELIDTSGDSNHAAIGHNTVETAAEFVVLTTLLNLSGSSHNSFSTLAPVNADEGTIPYALQTTVEDEFVWNNSVHAGHTTRAGENLTVSESEVSEIRNLNFEAADVSDFSAEDIATLTSELIGSLTAIQIGVLPPAAAQGFSSDQISELSTDAVSALTKSQVKQLSEDAVSGLTKAQVSELSGQAIRGFTGDQIAQLPKRTFAGLESAQLTRLSKNAMTGLTAGQLKTLSRDDFKAFKAVQIKLLSEDAIKGLTADQIAQMPNRSFKALESVQLAKLSKKAMTGITAGQLKTLSGDDFKAFKAVQIKQLPEDAIKGLTADQIAQMPNRTFKALEPVQLAKLSKDAVTGLTTGQLRTLSGEELGVFRPGQIQAISSETIAGLKPAALDDLSRRQVKAFTDAQLAGLSRRQVKNADDFIDALSTEQREALSFSPSSSNRLVDPLGQDELHLLAGLDPLS